MDAQDNTSPITDEDRKLAEAKAITLQPLHPDTVPEVLDDQPEQRRREDLVANIPNDIEQSTAAVEPSASIPTTTTALPSGRPRFLAAGIIGGIFLAAGAATTAIYIFAS